MSSERYNWDQNSSNGASFVAGLFTGVIIGAGVGLLLAPRSGAELRGQIADSAASVGKKVSDTIDAVADAGRDAYQQARDVAVTASDEFGRLAGDLGRSAERSASAIRAAAHRR